MEIEEGINISKIIHDEEVSDDSHNIGEIFIHQLIETIGGLTIMWIIKSQNLENFDF
jgi:hypothetical protein